MAAFQKALPQLKELLAGLQEIHVSKVQLIGKWKKSIDIIGDAVAAVEEKPEDSKSPVEQRQDIRNRMRKAHANREKDPGEWEAAQQAYAEFKK
jgi:hypothetical protein